MRAIDVLWRRSIIDQQREKSRLSYALLLCRNGELIETSLCPWLEKRTVCRALAVVNAECITLTHTRMHIAESGMHELDDA